MLLSMKWVKNEKSEHCDMCETFNVIFFSSVSSRTDCNLWQISTASSTLSERLSWHCALYSDAITPALFASSACKQQHTPHTHMQCTNRKLLYTWKYHWHSVSLLLLFHLIYFIWFIWFLQPSGVARGGDSRTCRPQICIIQNYHNVTVNMIF